MPGAAVDRDTERKANDLYWGSQSSVNQIAEKLDLSKGTLYGLIRPLPSGLTCPACSQESVYPNRTARERALVACPSCGWEGDESEADAGTGDGSVTLPDAPDDVDDVEPPPVTDGDHRRVIAGGALLGAAVGLALVLWARRR
jgi:hypothetical protein